MKKILVLSLSVLIFTISLAQNVGIGVPAPLEKLDVSGAIRFGNTLTTNPGTIRFINGRFEGYNGTGWNWLNGFKLPLDTSVNHSSAVLKITNPATTGAPIGVFGLHASGQSGAGLLGHSLATVVTGENSGVYAQNDGVATGGAVAYGVYGNSIGLSGNAIGVHGRTSSTEGKGVWGIASAGIGITYGVYGQSNSNTGFGVYGSSNGLAGVYGNTNTASTIGVYATNTAGGKALETSGGIKLTGIGEETGKVLTSDASGNATWQYPLIPGANTGLEVSTVASQSIPTGVPTKINFNTEYTDDASAFNNTTSTWTIPSSGFYHLTASVTFSTYLPTNTLVIVWLYVNGFETKNKWTNITGQLTIDISADIKLNINNTVTVYVTQFSGAPATLSPGRANIYFSGFKVY